MNDFSIFEKCFREKKNITFIMINDNYQSFDIYSSCHTKSQQITINFNRVNKMQIDDILIEITNLLSKDSFSKGINIILFYEYFFSRKPILYKAKETLISKIKNVSKNFNNTLFFVPIFYQLENEPDEEYIENIINYNNCIITEDHPFANWDVNYFFIQITKNKKNWIANEVLVIFEEEVILSHKKAVFFYEIVSKELLETFNYDFGFGLNNIITNNNNVIELAKIVDKYVSIQICKECQNELLFLRKYFMKFDEEKLYGDNKKYFIEKKKLFQKLEMPKDMEKNIYLIFSNSTTIENILHTFKENSIIAQIDPFSNGLFTIKYNEVVKAKIKELIININDLTETEYTYLSNIIKRNFYNVVSEIKYDYDRKEIKKNNYRFSVEYFKIS